MSPPRGSCSDVCLGHYHPGSEETGSVPWPVSHGRVLLSPQTGTWPPPLREGSALGGARPGAPRPSRADDLFPKWGVSDLRLPRVHPHQSRALWTQTPCPLLMLPVSSTDDRPP